MSRCKTYTVDVAVDGVTFTVTFEHTPACRGRRDRYGVPLEPDEPEDVEVETVIHYEEELTHLLSDHAFDQIRTALLEMEEY